MDAEPVASSTPADAGRRDELAPRPLTEPALSRLPLEALGRAGILNAHSAALERADAGYLDPATGLFVLSAGYLAARGFCCTRGCRHCPYVRDGDQGLPAG